MKKLNYILGLMTFVNLMLIIIVVIRNKKEIEDLKRCYKTQEDSCNKCKQTGEEHRVNDPLKSRRGSLVAREDILQAIRKLKKEKRLEIDINVKEETLHVDPTCDSPDSGCFVDSERESFILDSEFCPTVNIGYWLNREEVSKVLKFFDKPHEEEDDSILYLYEDHLIQHPSRSNTILEYVVYISLNHVHNDLIKNDFIYKIYKIILKCYLHKIFLVGHLSSEELSHDSEFYDSSFDSESSEYGVLRESAFDISNIHWSEEYSLYSDNFHSKLSQTYKYSDASTNELKNEILNVLTCFFIQLKENLKEEDQDLLIYIFDCFLYVFHQSVQMFEVKSKLETLLD